MVNVSLYITFSLLDRSYRGAINDFLLRCLIFDTNNEFPAPLRQIYSVPRRFLNGTRGSFSYSPVLESMYRAKHVLGNESMCIV